MGRFASFLGKQVEVQYRSSEVHLFTVGMLAVDTEKSICLEDRYFSGGTEKTIRIEIPYSHVIRVVEISPVPTAPWRSVNEKSASRNSPHEIPRTRHRSRAKVYF